MSEETSEVAEATEVEAQVDTSTEETGDPWESVYTAATQEVETPEAEETPAVVEGQDDAETVATTEAPAEEPEDEPTPEEVLKAEGNPIGLSRRALRKFEEDVITPLRNPEVPITEVHTALSNFHPERMRELEQAIVNTSLERFPNQWLEAITGIEGITVDQFKAALVPKTELSSDAEEYLKTTYGDNWRDLTDKDFYEDDVRLASVIKANDSIKAELGSVKGEFDSLKPEIESVKQAQEAEFKKAVESTYKSEVETYRAAVENRVMPSVLEDAGLNVVDGDTEIVKAVKGEVQALFDDKYGVSQFDLYLQSAYPEREAMGRTIQRVDSLLQQAAARNAEADRRASGERANVLREEANGLKAQASSEQAALVVMYKKAAGEFLKGNQSIKLLQENAALQKQLGMNGKRVEIVGQSAANGKPFTETLKEAEDKWDSGMIWEQAGASR